MLLFFASCDSFRIVNGTLFLAKDGNNTSIQKLTEVHVNTSQVLARVFCIKKKNIKKNENNKT
jgi:hypothetical protein